MGRKKKKAQKPWCWYCNREFEDEKILIQHQKAKHFKCHICNKKLFTGPGLAIHCMQVHKESIDKIPGAVPGRDNVQVEVYGMEGIPADSVRGTDGESTPPPAKIPRPNAPSIPMPGMMPPGMAQMQPTVPGMPPMPVQQFLPSSIPYGMTGFAPPRSIPPQIAAMMGAGMIPSPAGIVSPIGNSSAGIPLPSGGPSSNTGGIPMPPQAAFAAYQDSGKGDMKGLRSELSGASTSRALGAAKTRIVCPDELTSLEELMALRVVPQFAHGLMPFVR